MTPTEINRYCHEQILGKCWHGPMQGARDGNENYHICTKCKVEGPSFDSWARHPKYTTDLNAVRKVEEAVIAKAGGQVLYWKALLDAVPSYELPIGMELITASAEQRARACVAAHQAATPQAETETV